MALSVLDKQSLSVRVTARGRSTHSSHPIPDSAIVHLSRALDKLAAYQGPPRITQIPSTLGAARRGRESFPPARVGDAQRFGGKDSRPPGVNDDIPLGRGQGEEGPILGTYAEQ